MKLVIFTQAFPYGSAESYLVNELPFLQQKYDEVILVPNVGPSASQVNESGNLKIHNFSRTAEKLQFSDHITLISIYFTELFYSKKFGFVLKNFRGIISRIKANLIRSKQVLKSGLINDESHYYSYWMNDWAISLAILKKQKKIKSFIFRINGFDIYDERHPGNYLQFRFFTYKHTTKVFALSKSAKKYVQDLNTFPNKIEHQYFGTQDLGEVEYKTVKTEYVVYSIARVVELKRLPKIAEVLSNSKHNIKWIHQGEGDNEIIEEVKSTLKENVNFIQFNSVIDYSTVIERMKSSEPDLFINLSRTEGLPVSAIEAISLGIPLLMNDVGSCGELITPETGVLVEKDDEPKIIAEKLDNLLEANFAKNNQQLIREFWKQNFMASVNYKEFADLIYDLGNGNKG